MRSTHELKNRERERSFLGAAGLAIMAIIIAAVVILNLP